MLAAPPVPGGVPGTGSCGRAEAALGSRRQSTTSSSDSTGRRRMGHIFHFHAFLLASLVRAPCLVLPSRSRQCQQINIQPFINNPWALLTSKTQQLQRESRGGWGL